MLKNDEYLNIHKEILEFNKLLLKYVKSTSEINKFDHQTDLIQIYEINLKKIMSEFKTCFEQNSSRKKESDNICVSKLRNDFEILRSNISIRIEKERNNVKI